MEKYRSWVEVDLKKYAGNLNKIKKFSKSTFIMAVVKADAYGHGAIEIARTAINNGVRFVGVANAEEGIHLRLAGLSERWG